MGWNNVMYGICVVFVCFGLVALITTVLSVFRFVSQNLGHGAANILEALKWSAREMWYWSFSEWTGRLILVSFGLVLSFLLLTQGTNEFIFRLTLDKGGAYPVRSIEKGPLFDFETVNLGIKDDVIRSYSCITGRMAGVEFVDKKIFLNHGI